MTKVSPGEALITCTVKVDGKLTDCSVTSESPPGHGFGAATLKVMHLFRVKPATRNGIPVEAKITIPVRWQAGPAKQTGAPPTSAEDDAGGVSATTPAAAPLPPRY